MSDIEELDMTRFGHLTQVNKDNSPREGLIECILDTGTVMYIPISMWDTLNLKFSLEEKS